MTGRSGAPFMEEADKCDGAENDPRTLIHIGIVHTEADMGALSESIQRATLQRLSVKAWRRKLRAIDKRWTEIEEIVERLPLPRGKVRLYQDGLPVCGRELEIVEELANQGSRNHRLLLRLIEKGAVIMGTESPDLLLEEYERVKQALVLQNVRRGGGPKSSKAAGAIPCSTGATDLSPTESIRRCVPAKQASFFSGCCTRWKIFSIRTSRLSIRLHRLLPEERTSR